MELDTKDLTDDIKAKNLKLTGIKNESSIIVITTAEIFVINILTF